MCSAIVLIAQSLCAEEGWLCGLALPVGALGAKLDGGAIARKRSALNFGKSLNWIAWSPSGPGYHNGLGRPAGR
jgi:hypothetical protein